MDNSLENKIRNAILSHEAFDENWSIEIFDNGGVITITGTVRSKEDIKLIESIVNEQDGVIIVINQVSVDSKQ